MVEPSEMAMVPARAPEPTVAPEPYLSRWGAQAEQRRWAAFQFDRLRQFGHGPYTF